MYTKLSIRNARRSMMDYLIYLVTLVISVSLFYAFLSVSSSHYQIITMAEYNFEQLYTYLRYGTYLVSAVLIFLVYQVNKYMIKRRKREFATYVLLGMEQTRVAFLFFIETLVVLSVSMVIGILCGTLFSQVLTSLILAALQSDITLQLRVYPDTMLQTVLFFLLIFIIIGLLNVRQLRKLKLIDMLNDDKKTEIQFTRGKWFYLTVAAVSMACFAAAAAFMKRYLNIQPLASVDVSVKNQTLFLFILFLIAGVYGLFFSLGYLLVLVKQKSVHWKYKKTNLFLIGSLLSKISTTSFMLATITLTLLGAIVSFVFGPVASQWAKGYLEYRSVYDIQINNVYNSIAEINDLPVIHYQKVKDYIADSGFGIKESAEFELKFVNEEDFFKRRRGEFPVLAISLSDLNQLRTMAGYEEIALGENEFTTQWDQTVPESGIRTALKHMPALSIGDSSYHLSSEPFYKESLGESIFNFYTDYLIVIPDAASETLITATTNFYANTSREMSYEFAEGLSAYAEQRFRDEYAALYAKYENDPEFKDFIVVRTGTEQMNNATIASLLINIIGLYLGTILLIICLTLLALQQLSDSLEHKKRYMILQKLGVESESISRLVFKQIGIYFGIPLFTGFFSFIVLLYLFSLGNVNKIRTFVGSGVFVMNLMVALFLVVVIYTAYFFTTYISFKRNLLRD